MDAKTKSIIERGKLAQIESDFIDHKLNGTDTAEVRAGLEKARREYREKWRTPTANSVQPATVKAKAKG